MFLEVAQKVAHARIDLFVLETSLTSKLSDPARLGLPSRISLFSLKIFLSPTFSCDFENRPESCLNPGREKNLDRLVVSLGDLDVFYRINHIFTPTHSNIFKDAK